jgi:VIT1/CCC1 family predicted Fe2+/Mn2+ transporter
MALFNLYRGQISRDCKPNWSSGNAGSDAAAIISLIAHFVVGAAKTIVTGRSWCHSGMEMTIVGAIEAVMTYVLGAVLRVAA